jgi:hypothetical protein
LNLTSGTGVTVKSVYVSGAVTTLGNAPLTFVDTQAMQVSGVPSTSNDTYMAVISGMEGYVLQPNGAVSVVATASYGSADDIHNLMMWLGDTTFYGFNPQGTPFSPTFTAIATETTTLTITPTPTNTANLGGLGQNYGTWTPTLTGTLTPTATPTPRPIMVYSVIGSGNLPFGAGTTAAVTLNGMYSQFTVELLGTTGVPTGGVNIAGDNPIVRGNGVVWSIGGATIGTLYNFGNYANVAANSTGPTSVVYAQMKTTVTPTPATTPVATFMVMATNSQLTDLPEKYRYLFERGYDESHGFKIDWKFVRTDEKDGRVVFTRKPYFVHCAS